jgi:Uma2 family endonuclease
MSTAAKKKAFSRDNFLAWEERQEARWEFLDGVIAMMAGGTIDHNKIVDNVAAALRPSARARGCWPFQHNQKLAPRANDDVAYPDLAVVCGDVDGRATVVPEAMILVEVVSKSSRMADYAKKWDSYRTVGALRHYLVIEQDEAMVTSWNRSTEDEPWRQESVEGLDGEIDVAALGLRVTLRQIYEGTTVSRGG